MVRPVIDHNIVSATGTGRSGPAIDTRGHHKVTMVVTATGILAGGVTKLEGSADGTNWYLISLFIVTADGTFPVYDMSPHKYVRATIGPFSGTYDVWLVLGGHAGSGDWYDN